MAAHVDPLVVGRVIGDVADLFMLSVAISVQFHTMDVTNSIEIKPSDIASLPAVNITGRANDLFTLVGTTSSQKLASRMQPTGCFQMHLPLARPP
jgi:phosphatidylethanolamine-binding protein